MKLYKIEYDSQSYFVEAENLAVAVEAWKRHVAKPDQWGADYDGTEEPESIGLIHDEPVIR